MIDKIPESRTITKSAVREALRVRTVNMDLDVIETQLLIMERDMKLTPDEARTMLLGALAVLQNSEVVHPSGVANLPPLWYLSVTSGRTLKSLSKFTKEIFKPSRK